MKPPMGKPTDTQNNEKTRHFSLHEKKLLDFSKI